MTRNRIQLIVFWLRHICLLPWIVIQGKRVKANSIRLPEADGERYYAKSSDGLQLLHIGESTVAGVGAQHMADALTLQTVNELEADNSIQISDVRIYGVNGISLKQLLQQSKDWLDHEEHQPSCFIITLGVNDTTGLTSLHAWNTGLREIIQLIESKSKSSQVVFTHVPDMKRFPALPWPLNQFLGDRSRLLDKELQRICHQYNCIYVSADIKVEDTFMAEDGYHPNALGYERWGKEIAKAILKAYQ